MKRNDHSPVSAEQLNAYIDDELDFEERQQVFEQLSGDEELTHEAQELRQLRAMLRNAYRNPPPAPGRSRDRQGMGLSLKGLAAGLLLGIGAMTGWYGNERFAGSDPLLMHEHGIQLNTAAVNQENLLLHVSSNDPARMEAALIYAEQQLAAHRDRNTPFRLEVVANDGGIELLRHDTSPFPQRIETLLRNYDNVTFLACANALRKLREQGVEVELLPGTRSDHTALDQIIERLEGGWRYVKA